MKWRNLIFLILIIPVVLYGAAKGFLWYSVNSAVTNVQTRVSEFATLDYEGIRTPVLGPIGVDGITYKPLGFDQSIQVGSVLVHWNEAHELLDLITAFYKEALPKQLRISVNHINIPLGGDIADWWDSKRGSSTNSSALLPAGLWGCGAGALKSADYRGMGYESLTANLRFEYGLNRKTKTFSFYGKLDNQEMGKLYLDGSAPAGGVLLSVDALLNSPPRLSNLSITFEDDSFNARKIEYCSKLVKTTQQQYLQDHVARVAMEFSKSGVHPSAEIIDAYRSFLTGNSKLTLVVNPYEPIDPEVLAKVDPENLVEWLGLEVVLGETPIKEILAPKQLETATAEEEQKTGAAREETFNPTPIERLAEHVGKLTRVKTKDAKFHYAYLEEAGTEKLTLTQHLAGGSATFVINVTDIEDVSVLY